MNITITTRHSDATAAIEEYITKKAEKIPHYFDRVSAIEVVVDHQKSEHLVECIVSVSHGDPLVSHASSDDMYAAIDKCTDRAIRQVSDLKSNLQDHRDHRHHSGDE